MSGSEGTFLCLYVDGEPVGFTPVNPEVLTEACDALARGAELAGKTSKTRARLTNLYDLFFDWKNVLTWNAGPPASTSPLRKDTA